MELVYAFCAKFADVGPDGLLSVIGGGIDSVNVPQFPAAIAAIAVVGCVSVPLEECEGDHRLQIELFGPTGDRNPLEIDFPLDFHPRLDAPPRDPRMSFAVSLQNLLFGVDGRHQFRILVDSRQLGTIPFYVIRQAAAQEGQT
jgi:hypothetical protein